MDQSESGRMLSNKRPNYVSEHFKINVYFNFAESKLRKQ